MKLYFVRHGESVANLLWVFSNTGFKHPLTEKGIEQANILAGSLAEVPVKHIYSSPIMRAMQTAQILSSQLGASMETSEALREWSVGIYEGTDAAEGWALHRDVQQDWFVNNRPESKMPNGESLLDIHARFKPFIDSVVQKHSDTDQTIILVAHGGLYLAMLPIILTNIDFNFAQEQGFPHTGYTVAENQADGLHCLSWCGKTPESKRGQAS